MKNYLSEEFSDALKQFWLKMRITCLMLIVFASSIFALNVNSQISKVSIKLNDASVLEIINEIENQTDYLFVYDKKEVDLYRKVNVDAVNKDFKEVLSNILRNTNIRYSVKGTNIIFIQKTELKQQIKISGQVTDSSDSPLPGVTVVVKGTTQGTITDSDGNYTLSNVPGDGTLVFSFVGMISKEIPVAGKKTINLILAKETIGIEEVVAIGYGTMKKSDLTGSISSINTEDVSQYPTTEITQALQARVPGLEVIKNTGAPGGAVQIRIRGTSSIKGGNAPLWIIDGFPGVSDMLHYSDIESIEVLKDASATAIYGSQGANGVIIVTTQKGKTGKTKITYEGSFTVNTLRKRLDVMNAEEYMEYINILQLNNTGREYFTEDEILNAGEGTSWQDFMFRNAPVHNHSLDISGGNEKTKFLIGGTFYDEAGIVENSGYQRITMNSKVNHQINEKLSLSCDLRLSRQDIGMQNSGGSARGGTLMSSILSFPPIVSPYQTDGSYTEFETPYSPPGFKNPLVWVKETKENEITNRINARLNLEYKPIDDLTIQILGNYYNREYRRDEYKTRKFPQSEGVASISTARNYAIRNSDIITYSKILNKKHKVSAMGGIDYAYSQGLSFKGSGIGFLSDIFETHKIQAANSLNVPESSFSESTLISFFSRLNYSYNGKYLATITYRADGTSHFSKSNKWGYFPSGSLAWRISEEDFMSNIDFISQLKLRGGYGATGNQVTSPYSTIQTLDAGKIVLDKDLYTYFAPGSGYPGDLKWETTYQFNLGLDAGFFNQKLQLTADIYKKNTKDLLVSVPMVESTGYNSGSDNIGEIQNKGFELQLEAIDIGNRELRLDVSANISINRNKVIDLYEGRDIPANSYSIVIMDDYVNLVREGQPLSIFYGFLEDGYDEDGKVTYKDLNEDGKISVSDKTYIGNPHPDFTYGLNSNLRYKDFELSLFIMGTYGNDIFSYSYAGQTHEYIYGINMISDILYDHWTEESPNAKFPKLSASSASYRVSDRFVFDGSYLRLKNIRLTYNVPFSRLGIKGIDNGQIYISGQNLLTITNYPWWDPEVNAYGGLNQGIDHFRYPTTKGVTAGIKLNF